MSENIMNADKLYDAADEMGLAICEARSNSIWLCDKRIRYGVNVSCIIRYDKCSKYYELEGMNIANIIDKRTLYYGLSLDDLINEMKEFYRRNEIRWNR